MSCKFICVSLQNFSQTHLRNTLTLPKLSLLYWVIIRAQKNHTPGECGCEHDVFKPYGLPAGFRFSRFVVGAGLEPAKNLLCQLSYPTMYFLEIPVARALTCAIVTTDLCISSRRIWVLPCICVSPLSYLSSSSNGKT